jgi:hypothetical protein
MRFRPSFILACLTWALLTTSLRAQPLNEVDLALVLAVDVSGSMDPEEQELQRKGFVDAFRSDLVHDAIKAGMLGRIAVSYMEWAGSRRQTLVIPWTTIESPEGATEFAERLAGAPTHRAPRTSISGAIDFSMRLFDGIQVEPLRRVIDISGDGVNNEGRPVAEARDQAVARGITINGLPLMLKRARGYWDVDNLDQYFRDCVIGGAGAFMVPVRERQQLAQAIKTKIVREIAGLDAGLRPVPVQADAPTNCSTTGMRDWDGMRN